jgi:Family of unknown function (DUF6599)
MRHKALAIVRIAAFVIAALQAAPSAPAADMAAYFPDLDGWQKREGATMYSPGNLFEYIDGAAENFLAYGFLRLAVQEYRNQQGQAISAEIYFHGTPENAFGIYGSEKPLAGSYLAIGSQGYGEEGILNFISDAYYVKLNGFDLGPAGVEILKTLAEKMVAAINGRNGLPQILEAFPAQGRVPNSERFILSDFLGHDFLGSAFIADYDRGGQKFQLFVMRAGDENEVRAILKRYASLDKSASPRDIQPGFLTIRDPYNGPVRLAWRGKFIWGAIGLLSGMDDLLAEIGRNLNQFR